jgi:hypothetical protein
MGDRRHHEKVIASMVIDSHRDGPQSLLSPQVEHGHEMVLVFTVKSRIVA